MYTTEERTNRIQILIIVLSTPSIFGCKIPCYAST